MPYCSVLSCRNQSKYNNLIHGGISYHRFPHDPHLKEIWIDATGRQNWMPTRLSTICSRHFDPKCFVIKQSGYRYLSDKAVPTMNFVRFYVENQLKVKQKPSPDSDSEEELESQNQLKIKEEPLPDSDSEGEPESRLQNINIHINTEVKSEPHINTECSFKCTNTGDSTYELDILQNDTPQEQKLKNMLRGRNELIKRQSRKIKQLQARLRRLSKRYAIIEGELRQRKIEDDQMGITREKYIYKEPTDTTENKQKEIEFVKV